MTKRICVTIAAAASLAGCVSLGDPTDSAFATPSSAGNLSRVDSGARSGSDFSAETGNGYGYQVGAVREDGLQGFAGLVPGASVDDAPVSGSAEMNGTFEVALIDNVLTDGTSVSGTSVIDRGTINLTVDFGNDTVVGGGTGLDGGFGNFVLNENELEVDGRISNGELTGTVTYDGVSGPLRGLVGENEMIGAFHGHSDHQVHAGGFIAN